MSRTRELVAPCGRIAYKLHHDLGQHRRLMAHDMARCGQVPPHDRIVGNVTTRFALETFASGGGPGARIAALHLARLEEKQQ